MVSIEEHVIVSIFKDMDNPTLEVIALTPLHKHKDCQVVINSTWSVEAIARGW